MGTYIILAVMVLIILYSVISSVKHFKGEGGCCGGGDSEREIRPARLDHVIKIRTMSIQGMKCKNCAIRIQNALNSNDHISARVNYKKQTAVIRMDEEVDDSILRNIVQKLGYRVSLII